MKPDPRNPTEFYTAVETASSFNDRLRIFLEEYELHRRSSARPLKVLDIGCGRKAVLSARISSEDDYVGVDIAPPDPGVSAKYEVVDLNTTSLRERFTESSFDLVFCGEVIEHLFSPDALLVDLKALLNPGGIIILSTPNLAYWLNRILLLIGVSPLFLENSSRRKLGRRFRFLGQGNRTEGHIRLFTFGALKEFVLLNGFDLARTRAAAVWPNPVDRALARVLPRLAPDLVFVLKPNGS